MVQDFATSESVGSRPWHDMLYYGTKAILGGGGESKFHPHYLKFKQRSIPICFKKIIFDLLRFASFTHDLQSGPDLPLNTSV